MTRRSLALVGLACLGLACGWLSPPELVQIPPTRIAPTAPPAPAVSALTPDQVKNARVQLVFQNAHSVVQLANGAYQSTTDVASPDFMSINLAPQMAFGDLNGDGAGDAALLLAENYGGSGVFVSLIAMLDENGQPVQAASAAIDDRPKNASLRIQSGQILLDVTVHGPNDPGCCAAQETSRVYDLSAGKLVLRSFISKTPDGGQRVITIDSPAPGAAVPSAFSVAGHITIAPFENSLQYTAFDANDQQVAAGSFLVQAEQPGSPAGFSLPLELGAKGFRGALRIQIEETSPADGSILSLGSVVVMVK